MEMIHLKAGCRCVRVAGTRSEPRGALSRFSLIVVLPEPLGSRKKGERQANWQFVRKLREINCATRVR